MERIFHLLIFLSQLAQIDTAKTLDYQPSTAALHSFFYLALHMIANGAIVPQIVALPNKHFKIRWLLEFQIKSGQKILVI